MARNKMFVVEARRMLPLLLLLVLLVSLSVYDSLRTSPTAALEGSAQGNQVNFITADKGERKDTPTFRLAADEAAWREAAKEWAVTLPEYPFRPQHEVALFALHAEVQNVQTSRSGEGEMVVEVRVNPKRDHYQVLTLPAAEVSLAAGKVVWQFVNKKGAEIDRLVVENTQATITEEIPQK